MHKEKSNISQEEDYRSLVDDMPAMVCCFLPDGTITFVNKSYCECLQASADDLIGKSFFSLIPEMDQPWVMGNIQSLSRDNPAQSHEHQVMGKDGKNRWHRWTDRAVFDDKGCVLSYRAVGEDVTWNKNYEQEQDITLKILSSSNRQNGLKDLIRETTALMQNWSGCEAVGIRLKEGNDYPYYETQGFPKAFVKAENHLCSYDRKGKVIRDNNGLPVLECMCGNVIEGRFDPSLAFFTPFGSFWSNCTTDLLASTTEKERKARTRNRCNGEGYESVALIPLKAGTTNMGLLQFNDSRRNMFQEHTITQLERLASSLALALSQRMTALALKESEYRYRSIFDHAADGIILIDPSTTSIVDFNNKTLDILGYTRKEFALLNVGDFEVTESPEQIMSHVACIMETGSDSFETRHRTKDGHLRDISVSASALSFNEKMYILCNCKDITKRKEAEALLRTERDLMKLITETSPSGITRVNARGQIVYANKRAEEILGLKRMVLFQKTIQDLSWKITDYDGVPIPCDDLPYNQAKCTGRPVYNIRHAIEYPDGRKVLLNGNTAPIYNSAGEFDGTVASFDDVTETHRNEKNYQMLFRQMIDGFSLNEIILDDRGKPVDYLFLAVNPAFERQTGLKADAILGKRVREVLPKIEDYWIDTYGKVALTGDPVEFENYAHELGRHYHVSAFCPAKGQFACTFVDITKRKKAEAAFTESHERFLAVLDGIEASVYVADMETYEILFMNKAMIHAFGRDMTGETCWKSIRDELRPCPYCTNDKLVDEQGHAREVFVWQDESPVSGKWFINHDRAITWTDGRLVRIQIATDITEMKALEARLQHAQKMESIGNLAGGIAHDFNNILFPIVGMSEILLEELPENSQQSQNVMEIFKAGKRGRDLVKQILAFSRRYEHKKLPVRIQKVLKEVMSLVRSSIPSDIEIHQDIRPDCGLVMAAPTQIHQIAMNLITNAFHAVEHHGGGIRVSLKETVVASKDNDPTLSPGAYVKLTVSDTGHGIAPSHVEKIFEPYFTTKEQGKGTGLGLSVVYGIVKDHQGDIRVVSEPDKGTAFSVWLPLMNQSPPKKQKKARRILHPTGHEHILIVDDEDTIVNIETRILEKLGYKVTSFTSSRDALESFRSNPDGIDLVITDMTMPGITGINLAKDMMALKPKIPIIMFTGYSERIDHSMAKDMGIKGFLMKPIEKSQLAGMVRDVLDGVSS